MAGAIGVAGRPVPHDGRLPLVGDADGGDVLGRALGAGQRAGHHRAGVGPDLGRVVLDPAPARAGAGRARAARRRRSARRGRTGCSGWRWCPGRSRRRQCALPWSSSALAFHPCGWTRRTATRRVGAAGARRVRRRRHRRRGDRGRRGARRGDPGAVRRPGRGPGLGVRHVQPLVQAVPRRAALPRAAGVRAGARGAARARTDDDQARAAPREAGAVPLPAQPPALGAALRRVRVAALRHDRRAQQRARAEAPLPARRAADVPEPA